MNLNADHLDAFLAVVRRRSFSKAAKDISISQPALSQRIRKLEEAIGLTLLIRGTTSIELTDAAKKLLLHCKFVRDSEAQLLAELSSVRNGNRLTGVIRIAGFSSVMRSVILPSLTDLLAENPNVQIEALNLELYELATALKSGQSDFVISERPVHLGQVESIHLGDENYVLIESSKTRLRRPDLYFDHDSEDQITYDFFKKQRQPNPNPIQRSFLDENYSIIDAVERGLGRAVISRHLIDGNNKVRIVNGYTPMKSGVYINYLIQPIYMPLHERVKTSILGGCAKILTSSSA